MSDHPPIDPPDSTPSDPGAGGPDLPSASTPDLSAAPDTEAAPDASAGAAANPALPQTGELDLMEEDVGQIESSLKQLDANASPMCADCQAAWAATTDTAERVDLLTCSHR